MAEKYTQRGFRLFCDDLVDHDGQTIRVVESSLAFEGAHVRVYVGGGHAAHMSVAQAEVLRNALTAFVFEARNGKLVEPAQV